MRLTILCFLFILFNPSIANSHSGNTNQQGCHVNSYTGIYHCHQTKLQSPYRENWCIQVGYEQYCGYSSYSSCYNAGQSTGQSFQCVTR